MKKFLVTYKESRSVTREVEAETQDQAYDTFHNETDFQESDWEYQGEETEIDFMEDETDNKGEPMSKEQEKQDIDNLRLECPHCGADDVVVGGRPFISAAGEAWREVWCESCEKEWIDTHRISHAKKETT